MSNPGYSDEAKRFLALAEQCREKLTPEIRAQIILQDLKEMESSVASSPGAFDECLKELGPGGLHENCSGDEARAGLMSEDLPLEYTLWFSSIVYAADAIKAHRAQKASRAWDCVVEAMQKSSLLFGLLAGQGNAEAEQKLKDAVRLGGLERFNAQREAAKSWARERARSLWDIDVENKLRIGEVTQTIWREICDTEHVAHRPETEGGLRDWIRGVAPGYATKGGRPPKQQ